MFAYKAFDPGLKCRGYQFQMGLNETETANCKRDGFHCAEDPLDCLTYYNLKDAEIYIVEAGGDLDEDGDDSKISCTQLTILRKLEPIRLFAHILSYIVLHHSRKWNPRISQNCARAANGFAVVRGDNPLACGKKGDILALVKEKPDTGEIVETALVQVDGKKILPNVWYGSDLRQR